MKVNSGKKERKKEGVNRLYNDKQGNLRTHNAQKKKESKVEEGARKRDEEEKILK